MIQSQNDLARILDEAAHTAKEVEQISKLHQISIDEAYSIQAASIDRRLKRGEKITGFKLGFTSKAKMEQMGVHDIIWGRLTDSMNYTDGGILHRSKFIHPRVEPEIAFSIKKRIDKPISISKIIDYADGVAGALEVIDSRYKNFKFSLEDVIADNCSSSGYVIGPWMDISTAIGNLNISLLINDKEVQSGNSNAILGNPLESLVEISRMTQKYGFVIETGQVVLAGAATPAVYFDIGDRIEGHVEKLGSIMIKVV